jgi:hypothetical protein
MPHNLLIANYLFGSPRGTYDTYAFKSTQEHDTLLPEDHWIWADSAYPLEKLCITPFKKLCNGRLTRDQKSFNVNLSKVSPNFSLDFLLIFVIFTDFFSFMQVHVCVEHVFAALKGHFQSLIELRHPIQDQRDLQTTLHWVRCCLILHNMIICFEENHNKSTLVWAICEGHNTAS